MRRLGILFGLLVSCSANLEAGDWPQWGYDAGRGAVSPDELRAELHLEWSRQLPTPQPAWPASQPWLRFDLSYSPVAAGKLLYVPSMVTDSVTAYDTETGEKRWRFYADGPVRLAPLVHEGRVYFGSDDGYLYALHAAEGRLVWKFRGGPSDRKVLGNERLISTWPVRGGPVLLDGTIYFTAGIWPFMGIFVHAVDAESGESVWTNSGFATTYTVQPHNSPAFASLVPRGHLAATKHGLVVPGGRTEPGRFDLKTGELLGFDFGGKNAGSHHVTAQGEWFFAGGTMREIADGKTLRSSRVTLHDDSALYGLEDVQLSAQALEIIEQRIVETDRKGKKVEVLKSRPKDLWKCTLPEAPGRLFLKAGSRFYAGAEGQVAAIEVDPENEKAEVVWRGAFEGSPWTMLAADGKLFVVTIEGRIYCFGVTDGEPTTHEAASEGQTDSPLRAEEIPDFWRDAPAMIRDAGVRDGYCLLFGRANSKLAEHLARPQSEEGMPKLDLIAVDPDANRVEAVRRNLQKRGLYGARVSAYAGDPATFPLPPHLASFLFVLDDSFGRSDRDVAYLKAVFRALRPYGGTAHFFVEQDRLVQLAAEAKLEGAKVKPSRRGCSLVREGPLPGAADWTHQYADAANSVVSKDQRVKVPLGLLWFGGPPNDEVLPRHGHGPSPQVAGGRLFIEGRNMLRALDIYTGRLLWQKDLPDLGLFYDNTGHQPGAGEIGGNYVSLEEDVYVVYGDAILDLDAVTGKLKREFFAKKAEAGPDDPEPSWGFLAAHEDLLIATSTPIAPDQSQGAEKPDLPAGSDPVLPATTPSEPSDAGEAEPEPPTVEEVLRSVRYSSASRRLVVFDRRTGRKLWEREARYGFRHNSIVVGAGRLFLVDGLSRAKQETLNRRGVDLSDYQPRLLALDVRG
ncbi:MAG: PQQ-binding-like beta-propeller repeat protein, partial [Planctomycetota bacterium]